MRLWLEIFENSPRSKFLPSLTFVDLVQIWVQLHEIELRLQTSAKVQPHASADEGSVGRHAENDALAPQRHGSRCWRWKRYDFNFQEAAQKVFSLHSLSCS